MDEEFLATLKLVTGEEIISKVSYMPDEDSLVLENPLEVSYVDQQKKNIRTSGFMLTNGYIQLLITCLLPKQHVITMTEVEDTRMKNITMTTYNVAYTTRYISRNGRT